MKCAMEILKIKKAADMERAEQEHLAWVARQEKAKIATMNYAEEISAKLYECAKKGCSLIFIFFFARDGGLYRHMWQDSRPYKNGVREWHVDHGKSALNMEYLTELLSGLCYKVSFRECELYVNSYRKKRFYELTVSIPSTLPCE